MKVKGITARTRAAKRRRLSAAERVNKAHVRWRDQMCRFPLCRCRHSRRVPMEVSHAEHKGMGGDPTGERSAPEKMVFVCAVRHRISRWSIDRCGIRWRTLTASGANGPIAWDYRADSGEWVELARELDIQTLEPPAPEMLDILHSLSFP